MSSALAGRTIAVPETRELDVLAQMLERHGAKIVRCPLVAIHDVADDAPVVAWLQRFTSNPPDDLILMTGEGLQRLVGVARRHGLEDAFLAALKAVRKITRGPKPVRRLRMLGLQGDLAAEPPTTEGIIAALSGQDLAGRRVAIQLYPDYPHPELMDFLRSKGANEDPVLPYVYGSEIEDQRVVALIDEMAAGRIDLIAFTSSPQVRRLRQVAQASGRDAALESGLRRTKIAAVGPVVARAIERAGAHVSFAPEDNFHMKPMVNAIVAAIEQTSPC
jgi:uroporphyrinogen-III synthase